MALEGIPAFGREPYKLWVWNDVIACATYPNPHGAGLNGYVQLPADFPDLPAIADYVEAQRLEHEHRAANPEPVKGELAALISAGNALSQMPFCPNGYDFINDYVQVHGGLTYGPDEDRWTGFDTNHAFDDWSDAELERMFKTDHPDVWAELQHYWELLGHDSWPAGRISSPKADSWAISWTEQRVDAEVNNLASQIWSRHQGGHQLIADFVKKASSDGGS